MRAALAVLGACVPRSEFRRRVAVLGDMLELGAGGPELHAGSRERIDAAGVDVVFACGPTDALAVSRLLPARPPGRLCARPPRSWRPSCCRGVGAGDVVMVKGSLGSRMAPLVEALKRRFDSSRVRANRAAEGRMRCSTG